MKKNEFFQNNEEIKIIEDNLHDIVNWLNLGIIIPLETMNEWLKQENYEKMAVMLPNLIVQSRNILDEISIIQSNFLKGKRNKIDNISIALQELVDNWLTRTGLQNNITINIDFLETAELSENIKESLIAITDEAISNAIKHSGTMMRSGVEISINVKADINSIILEIQDNGDGTSKIKEGYGISKIKRILSELNQTGLTAEYFFNTSPGNGFKIKIEVIGLDLH